MAATLVKTAMLKITTDDGDSEAKMDRIQLKAEELAREHPELKIKIDQAAAAAKMGVIRSDFKKSVKAMENDADAGARKIADDSAKATSRMASNAAKAGNQAGQGFMSRFGSWLVPSKFQLITSAVGLGLAALPAAVGSIGVLAGISLGTAILVGTKKSKGPLYEGFHSLMSGLVGEMRKAAQPLVAPMQQAFFQIDQFARQMAPELRSMFAALAPSIAPLAQGFESLIRGVLPPFIGLIRAAHPAVAALAGLLGNLGRDMGSMFSSFAPAMKSSSLIFKGIGEVLNGILPVVGKLAASLAASLGPAFAALGSAVHALSPALGVIGQILGKLAGAVLSSLGGALSAIATLLKAVAPAFGVLASAMGRVFSLMENVGVFGILENSLEKIAGPLGRLIAALITGLAPVLPLVFSALNKVAGALVGGLASAITALLPGLIQIVQTVTKFTTQALGPLLPQLAALSVAFLNVAVQAIVPLLGPLTKLTAMVLRLTADVLTPLIPVLTAVVGGAAMVTGSFAKMIGAGAKVAGELLSLQRTVLGGLIGKLQDVGSSIASTWDGIVSGTESMVGRVVSWFEALPGKITSALSDAGHMLYSIGASIIGGLVSGVESAVGGLMSTIGRIAGDISGAFKGILGIFSPSRVFYGYGQMIVSGLANGLSQSGPAVRAARKLANDVASGFGGPSLVGGPAAGLGGSPYAKAAAAAAAAARQSALQFGTLGGVQQAAGQHKIGGKAYLTGLEGFLAKIRKFNADIGKLAHLGLDKALLQELIGYGPDQGLPIAEALLNGPISRIYNLNRTERAIERASRHLGSTAGGIASGSIGSRHHGHGGHALSQAHRVVVELDMRGGDTEFMSWLKKQIRVRGGDPALVGR